MLSVKNIRIEAVRNDDGTFTYQGSLLLMVGSLTVTEHAHPHPLTQELIKQELWARMDQLIYGYIKQQAYDSYLQVLKGMRVGSAPWLNPMEFSQNLRSALQPLLSVGLAPEDNDSVSEAKYPSWMLDDLRHRGYLSEEAVERLKRETVE